MIEVLLFVAGLLTGVALILGAVIWTIYRHPLWK